MSDAPLTSDLLPRLATGTLRPLHLAGRHHPGLMERTGHPMKTCRSGAWLGPPCADERSG